ncbi:pentatricopeptide repeat-containing protein DOT4, chloroplastic-like [Phoenix dactylifera]|uniref:Pentatricopeptide repeat-containing protein DOT4, chloroplastic-like n=1 Tax=Phoenix dactylifera TaxID=42345 RepID=A0A8B8ZDV7_PHODC|nr:pentatricopeptide repeat-containing protein DOT4, chloroplastic-like [Phoenix dactylifera]XP_038972290.1 pentatricopeptide repeat-containing protein DOT4, chloroplastic-like [Phoenix dactylifera]
MILSKPFKPSDIISAIIQLRPIKFLTQASKSPICSESHNFEPPQQLFDRIPNRNTVDSNSHIYCPTKSEKEVGAITLPSWVFLGGSNSLRLVVSCIVRAIKVTGSVDTKRGIHAAVIKNGFESEVAITTALIAFYSSLHELESARRLFYSTPIKDLILWSAMVSACCKNGQFIEAIDTFGEMLSFGVTPNNVSLLSVLLACANTNALLHGKQIHGYAIRKEFDSEISLSNSLVDMYAKCGKLDAAMVVFNGTNWKDDISWKNIIFGCIENGRPREAHRLFYDMRASCIEPDEITIRNVVRTCSQAGYLMFILGLHCYIIKNGLGASTSVGTALLRAYAEFKEVEMVQALFNQLHHKDHIAWSAMISAYSHSGHPDLALEMFKQMQLAKEEANEITFVSLLQACSLVGALELGKSIHAHVTRLVFVSNMFVTSALIDFYCKLGKLREAEILFGKLQKRDLVCWSSMINGYGINGCGEEAIQIFYNMLERGLMPNEVTFVSILSACSHCGLVDEGWKWFRSMKEKFGISSTLAHYTCIVDLLGRQGRVEEALEFVNTMPMEPDITVWGVLLSWCRAAHSDIKIAEFAAERLIQLDPSNTSCYVTLSNMYSKLGLWGDAKRIRGLMEDNSLRKTAGFSMV